MKSFDMIIVGAGIAGIKAAKRASELGANVGLVEKGAVGGTCPVWGCMPKKFMFVAADKRRRANSPGPRGFDLEVTESNWAELIEHERSVAYQLGSNYASKIDRDERIELIEGHARLGPEGGVRVDGEPYDADRVLLTPGLRAAQPPIEGVEHGQTSRGFFQDSTLPDAAVIVGGGYIGVELAAILETFGTEVTILEMESQLIPQYDRDVAEHLAEQLEHRGIDVRTSSAAKAIEPLEEGYRVSYEHDGKNRQADGDRVLVVAGRVPNTDDLGFEEAGVELDEQGFIRVDETYETTVPGVYAAGDVIGKPQLTPAATREGRTAVENALKGTEKTLDFSTLPCAVFTHPPVAMSGMTEEEARESYDRIRVGTSQFQPFDATVRDLGEETFIKTVFAGDDERLVGLHVVGESAYEIVQGFGLAMELGCTRKDLEDFSGVHPTLGDEVCSTLPAPQDG